MAGVPDLCSGKLSSRLKLLKGINEGDGVENKTSNHMSSFVANVFASSSSTNDAEHSIPSIFATKPSSVAERYTGARELVIMIFIK
jgi:hypothetical protein